MKQTSPAAGRNKEPIRGVLAEHLPDAGVVLTIAEGSGEHALHFARSFPELGWQPSDLDGAALASIATWRAEFPFPNLREPIRLDVTDEMWPVTEPIDAITCINMIHISPWEGTRRPFPGAARRPSPGALSFLYGPYRFGGQTAPSNAAFDASLRARDARWGVRDVDDIDAVAASAGFVRTHTVEMPANNHSLIYRRQ